MIFSKNCYILFLLFHLLLCILVSTSGSNFEIFEGYIFSYVGVRTTELALQVLWLLTFLQRKPWSSSLLGRAATSHREVTNLTLSDYPIKQWRKVHNLSSPANQTQLRYGCACLTPFNKTMNNDYTRDNICSAWFLDIRISTCLWYTIVIEWLWWKMAFKES